MRSSFQHSGPRPPQPLSCRVPWPETPEFEAALLGGHHRQAHAVLQRCLARRQSLIGFELHVIQPALYQIGEKWQTNQISVAQEHMATAIAQSVMTVGLQKAQAWEMIDLHVLLACVEGNHHALGLQMVADAFLIAGWQVQFLGGNVPSASLLQQADKWKPDVIGLSVSLRQQIPVAKTVISRLGQHFGKNRPAVMIGGLAFQRFHSLAGLLGDARFCSDSQAAVDFAGRIVEQQSI